MAVLKNPKMSFLNDYKTSLHGKNIYLSYLEISRLQYPPRLAHVRKKSGDPNYFRTEMSLANFFEICL